jgi:hypothetical protein
VHESVQGFCSGGGYCRQRARRASGIGAMNETRGFYGENFLLIHKIGVAPGRVEPANTVANTTVGRASCCGASTPRCRYRTILQSNPEFLG